MIVNKPGSGFTNRCRGNPFPIVRPPAVLFWMTINGLLDPVITGVVLPLITQVLVPARS